MGTFGAWVMPKASRLADIGDGDRETSTESIAVARLVVERLLAHGVSDVVLAPGSRSAPLALVLAAAERANQLALHVRIDERSAGFLALGLAKASGRAVPVICTSGSAVANLAPAVVEAAYSGVPLIAITADRPPELRGVGANQTIDQVGFFGQQVRTALDFATFPNDPNPSGGHRKSVDRMIADAIGVDHKSAAPVHLNIAFREPLVPSGAESVNVMTGSDEAIPASAASAVLREPIGYAVGDIGLASVPARGLVIVGDVGDPAISRQAVELAGACGWPILSEPSGNALCGPTAVAAGSLVLADEDFRRTHRPDLVVTVGRFGVSRPTLRIVAESANHIAIYTGGKDRPDPLHTASLILPTVPLPSIDDPTLPVEAADDEWLCGWLDASDAAAGRVSTAVRDGVLTGLSVSAQCWRASGANDVLFVAASRPVRNLEATMTPRQFPPRVLGNRGASGIDGLVSTAWGIAIAHERVNLDGRTIALLGDLAFLHDHNGLLSQRGELPPNLTIVVADNNGGGIFSSLEQGAPEFAADFERVFGTPHDVDLAAIARATGVPTTIVATQSALAAALASPRSGVETGVRIIIAATADRAAEESQWRSLIGW